MPTDNTATQDTQEATAPDEAKKKRVLQLAEDTADLMKDVTQRMEEMNELGVEAAEILSLVQTALGACFEHGVFYQVWAELFPAQALEMDGADPMRRLIGRLFAEAPKLTDGNGKPVLGQTPAIEAAVMLKSGAQWQGALTTTREGTLLLGAGTELAHPNGRKKRVLVEHYFKYDDVETVAVARDLPAAADTRPTIITASH